MGRRSDGQQIEHHGFAISIPSQRAETKFRLPFERKRVAIMQGPRPLDATINPGSGTANRRIVEILAAGQHAAQKNRHIDGRQLRFRETASVAHVHIVVEKAMDVRGVRQEMERPLDPGGDFGARPVVALVSNAQRGESEAGRRNAAHPALAAAVCLGPVTDQAGVRVGFVPEEFERSPLELVQQLGVGARR